MRIGFLPVSDCAPVVYAQEAGLFDNYGLDVELHREERWGTMAQKIIEGDLDAAHAAATLPFLANLGLESDPCACVSGLVLSLQGNAVVLSRKLWEQGVGDPETLRDRIYQTWGKHTYTFAVSLRNSSQEILLRKWLTSAGMTSPSQLRVIALPANQMFPTLKLGYIDGYCASEPWPAMAVQAGLGVCLATSAELAPWHPEKVLMVRQSFAAGSAAEHERLLAALLEACTFCDEPQNAGSLSQMLAARHYVDAPAECIAAGLSSADGGPAKSNQPPPCSVFARHGANEPDDHKARWLTSNLEPLLQDSVFRSADLEHTPVLKNIFRMDVFARAKQLAPNRTQPPNPASAVLGVLV